MDTCQASAESTKRLACFEATFPTPPAMSTRIGTLFKQPSICDDGIEKALGWKPLVPDLDSISMVMKQIPVCRYAEKEYFEETQSKPYLCPDAFWFLQAALGDAYVAFMQPGENTTHDQASDKTVGKLRSLLEVLHSQVGSKHHPKENVFASFAMQNLLLIMACRSRTHGQGV